MSTWRELADEHATLELLEAHDRIRDLERDRDIYRELLQAALDALHAAHTLEQRLRRTIRGHSALIRKFRGVSPHDRLAA